MGKIFLAIFLSLFLAPSCFAGQLLPYPKFKATDSSGVPYSGGLLYTYAAGTSTAKVAYTDVELRSPATNPIVLDSNGEAAVYLKGKYRLTLRTSVGVLVWTLDQVQGMGDWEEGKYYVDSSETDQGAMGAGNSIAAHLASIGGKNAVLVLANNSGSGTTSYTISTSITIPANARLKIEPGALLVKGTGSPKLTINGDIECGIRQIFSGWAVADITFGSVNEVYAEYWYSGFGSYDIPFQCAVQSFAFGPGKVKLLNKTYALVAGFTVKNHRVKIEGQGKNSSIFSFTPTGTATAVRFQLATSSMIVQCGIKGVGFTGGGTRKKTAIELVDVDVFDLEEVAVLNWTDATYASVGLKIKGRDMISINRIDINADIPIQISDNPNSGIDIDHTVFRDTYLIASSANPNVLVDSGVNLTNVSFEGYNAWCLGGFGFKWIDTAASMVGQSLSFRNIRWEQSTNAGGYIIDIEHNYNLWQLTIENVYGGLNTKGIKLRKCSYNSLINCQYVGSSTALDLDSTTRPTVLQNCNFIAGSSISSPGLTKIFSSGLSKAAAINGAFEIYDTLAPYSGQYFGGLSTYANNAAALAGGLKAGMVYKTSTGAIMIVY